jgi:Cof subfamily protein (haloacid dehalogenase superfamily)
MSKVYLTDLDHTFLRSDLSISAFSRDIWNDIAKTSTMGVATARTFKKSEQFLKGLCIEAPMVLLDGALIVSAQKQIVDTKILSQELADEVIEVGARMGLFPFVLALKDRNLNESFLYPRQRNGYQDALLLRYQGDDNLEEKSAMRAMRDNFKLVYMGDEMSLRALDEEIQRVFGDTLKSILAPEAYMGCYFLTLLHKDADKAHGLRKVREALDIDYEHFTVFGDNLNDLGMFSLAHTSVAVANAHEEIKRKATVVSVYSNDDDAVARYLDDRIRR